MSSSSGQNIAFLAILWHLMIHTCGVHAVVRNLWSDPCVVGDEPGHHCMSLIPEHMLKLTILKNPQRKEI